MQIIDDKQLDQPTAINHFGYAIPLYVISVLNRIVATKINYLERKRANNLHWKIYFSWIRQ